MRPRGITADRVVELCDGTRDAQQIADAMEVGIAYVRATVRRRKVGHLLVVRPPNPSLKVQLRAAEARLRETEATIVQMLQEKVAALKAKEYILTPQGDLVGSALEGRLREAHRRVMKHHGHPPDGVLEADAVREVLLIIRALP